MSVRYSRLTLTAAAIWSPYSHKHSACTGPHPVILLNIHCTAIGRDDSLISAQINSSSTSSVFSIRNAAHNCWKLWISLIIPQPVAPSGMVRKAAVYKMPILFAWPEIKLVSQTFLQLEFSGPSPSPWKWLAKTKTFDPKLTTIINHLMTNNWIVNLQENKKPATGVCQHKDSQSAM